MTRKEEAHVSGIDLDAQTRCAHYHKPQDIIAIKMKCCGVYYACIDCHHALAGHASQVWPRSAWDQRAVLCGNCRTELSVRQYLECGNKCPACGAGFNPGCGSHYDYYFEAVDAGLKTRADENPSSGPGNQVLRQPGDLET